MFILNNSKRTFIGWLAGIILLLALFFNLVMHQFFVREKGPKVNCTSFFTALHGSKTEGVLSLNLDGDGHGRINLSASFMDSGDTKKYNLLRNITFEYHYEGNGYLAMHNVVVNKKASDTMPNELFNESLFDFSLETRRLRLTEVNNGYLIWNAFSPVLMCIQES